MPVMRVLIIEDNIDLAANLYEYLEMKGHVPDVTYDGVSGLQLALVNDYDVMVLDIGLPGMDGLTLCRQLRDEYGKQIPVLLLTARDTLDDKLRGFEHGADDYLVKPFALQELLVRLLALSKRLIRTEYGILQVGDLSFNPQTLSVNRAGKVLSLTPINIKILECLLRHSPNVVSRAQLEAAVWSDAPPDSDVLRAHMHTLRNVVDRPFATALIVTVHGIGFKLVAE